MSRFIFDTLFLLSLTLSPTPEPAAKPAKAAKCCACEACKCGCEVGKPCTCERDISGVYEATGNDGKVDYNGIVRVEKIGQVYRFLIVTWGKAEVVAGIGVRQGDSISVGWVDGHARGVTTYKIAGKALNGRWASLPGNGVVLNERLTFMRALPAE